MTATLVEETTVTQTVHDTFTSTIQETPTETVYTETITITTDPVTVFKRAAIPTIPAYASPCSGAVRFSSACSCIGASSATTITAPASTTTVTLPSTALTTVPVTSVVATSVTVIYDETTTVTETAPAATISTISTTTVTKTSTSEAPAAPTNKLNNGGFESSSVAPWIRFAYSGTLSTDSNKSRSGSQSGVVTIDARAVSGMYQPVAVEAGQNYKFTIWVSQDTLGCPTIAAACSISPTSFFSVASTNGATAVGGWYQLSVNCNWNAQRLAGAGVSVILPSSCIIGTKVYIDDAELVKQ